ncbi:MAG: OmpA family protein, partial [Bacteroidales bacterium]|nr:OmpA family protein [Bacteroidales bacterium]
VALAFQPEEVTEVAEEVTEGAEEVTEAVEEVSEAAGDVAEAAKEVVEEVVEEAPETYMIRPVFFDFDSFSLTSAALKKLDELAEIMQRYPNIHLDVIGHTDAVGTRDYNFSLAQKRAKAVADHLVSLGVEEDRLHAESKGETEHVACNRTPDNKDAPRGRALNRRVHFHASVPAGIIHIAAKKIEVPEELQIK